MSGARQSTIGVTEEAAGALIEATVVRVTPDGKVFVRFEGDGGAPVAAHVLDAAAPVLVRDAALPTPVLLLVRTAPNAPPVVVGVVRERVANQEEGAGQAEAAPVAGPGRELLINGKRLVLDARDEIVLRCGRSTIEMRADGKIVIKGTHLLSRSAGMNRIKGGAVSIN